MKCLWRLYFHGNRDENKVALTFDDGPSGETLKILDLLKKYSAKATFFILAKRIKGRQKILQRIIKEGHEIGNHSFSHKALLFQSKNRIKKDLQKADDILETFNVKTNLVRPPYLRMGMNFLRACKDMDKKIIILDVISEDWKKPGVDFMVKKVLRRTKKGSIINMHDYLEDIGENPDIVTLVKQILPALSKRYKLVTVSEII